MALLTLTCTWLGLQWGTSTPCLLLITALSPRVELIKAGDNNNSKDYLSHYSYANKSYGVLRASGRNKRPPAFISQRTKGSGLFLLPCCVFWLSVFGWVGEATVGLCGGGLGVRAGVKSKCVIVTELVRESRGGQCADRTLACMIHRKGPLPSPLLLISLPSGCIMEPILRDGESPHVTSCVGDSLHLGLIGTLTCG